MTTQSSLTTSTSVSGLLPSTVHVVTVIGTYDEPGCSSISEAYVIKTTVEEDMRPGVFVQCVCGSAVVSLLTCTCASLSVHMYVCLQVLR